MGKIVFLIHPLGNDTPDDTGRTHQADAGKRVGAEVRPEQVVVKDPLVEGGAGVGVHVHQSGQQPAAVVDILGVGDRIERDPVPVDEHHPLNTVR